MVIFGKKEQNMKLNLDLAVPSKPEWIAAVMNDFPAFLQDHLDCERKASAMAMSFVAKYPDRTAIIPDLIATGIEELIYTVFIKSSGLRKPSMDIFL